MDVSQVRQKKAELEDAIRALVLQFESDTGCKVDDITLYPHALNTVALTVEVAIP